MNLNIPETAFGFLKTPLGWLKISENEKGITGVNFVADASIVDEAHTGINIKGTYLAWAIRELEEYFAGTRREFTVPLYMEGTPFYMADWEALRKIPYGETRSYQDIAIAMGNPKAARAVGMANNHNPIAIIVPCHRVIGKNRKLVGYASGLDKKTYLLQLEGNRDFR